MIYFTLILINYKIQITVVIIFINFHNPTIKKNTFISIMKWI